MKPEKEQDTAGARTWAEPVQEPQGVSAEDLAAWRAATARVRAVAIRDNLTQAELARRADMPSATVSLWYSGTYSGSVANQTARIIKWLDAYEEAQTLEAQLQRAPDFVPTPTAEELTRTLFMAQMMPDMAVVTLGSGMGKTLTAKHYVATHPSAYRVTMRPTTSAISTMLQEIANALDVTERNPIRRDQAIGQKLRRNGQQTLLIVDEAQNLVDKAVDQLRHFHDEYECGIALLGNNELYSRFGKGEPREGFGQIHRRIGKRLVRLRPLDGDVEALINAWAVEDPEVRKLLRAIGRKPGSLGQISKTMQLAGILAAGDRKQVELGHVRAAWENRGGEEAR